MVGGGSDLLDHDDWFSLLHCCIARVEHSERRFSRYPSCNTNEEHVCITMSFEDHGFCPSPFVLSLLPRLSPSLSLLGGCTRVVAVFLALVAPSE